MFTSVGFRGWKSIRTALKKHQDSGSHKASMTRWAGFRQTKHTGSVADQLDSPRRSTVLENRKYLKTMLKIALLCARQEIALRGHDESDKSDNKGNFREILSLLPSETLLFNGSLIMLLQMQNTTQKKFKMICFKQQQLLFCTIFVKMCRVCIIFR